MSFNLLQAQVDIESIFKPYHVTTTMFEFHENLFAGTEQETTVNLGPPSGPFSW